jgi:hypothetical protein
MGESLLIISLALVTIAVPIQLRLYGIPMAWALEGALLVYLGVRFGRVIVTAFGNVALFLSVCGLFKRLPLHTLRFVPVFNVPFGSWVAVIAAVCAAAYILVRDKERKEHQALGGGVFAVGFVLGCLLLSLEAWQFWPLRHLQHYQIHQFSSLALLWGVIPACTAAVLRRRNLDAWMPLAMACYCIGLIVFLAGLGSYDLPSRWPVFNYVFAARIVFLICLWWGGRLLRNSKLRENGEVLTITGHLLLAVLLAMEMYRWGQQAELISERMAVSLISAVWAVQACVLIWYGLVIRDLPRRILGFVLFAVTIGKVCFYDLNMLDRVYQIVSFLASGLLALVAGYFYQRYSSTLLDEEEEESG